MIRFEHVGDEVLGHRHLGLEVVAAVDLVGGVQHHQLATGTAPSPSRRSSTGCPASRRAREPCAVAVERAVDHHVERRLGLRDPAHAVRQPGRAEPVLAEQVALARGRRASGRRARAGPRCRSRSGRVPPCIVSTSRTSFQPSDGRSTMNAVLAACGSSGSSSVRAMRIANVARRALEMNHL